MLTFLNQVDDIIVNRKIAITEKRGFNKYQCNEEREKLVWSDDKNNPVELLYELEDHHLLQGQIAIIGLNSDIVDLRTNAECCV